MDQFYVGDAIHHAIAHFSEICVLTYDIPVVTFNSVRQCGPLRTWDDFGGAILGFLIGFFGPRRIRIFKVSGRKDKGRTAFVDTLKCFWHIGECPQDPQDIDLNIRYNLPKLISAIS